jgi:hypothetical protein
MTELLDTRQPADRSAISALRPLHRPASAGWAPPLGGRSRGPSRSRRATRTDAAALGWLRLHATSLLIVSGLIVVAAIVLGTGIARYPGFGDDEGTYVAQAWAVLAHGSLSHYTYWYDHPPLGWLQLAVATSLSGPILSGASAVSVARSLMLVPALTSAGVLYLVARRMGLRKLFAAAAVLLFVCSPLAVTSLRQVYLDNIAVPWLLAAFALAASPSKRLWAFAGSGACFAIAVLTKETMLLFLPALMLALLQTVDRRTRAFCVTAFFTALMLIGIGYPLYALLKGELLPGPGHVSLVQAVAFQLVTRPGTGSALAAGSPARQLVDSWLQTDPWLLGLGVVSAPIALVVRRLRPAGLAILVPVAVALHGGYLPQPFVIGLLPFCGLLIAGLLDRLWALRAAGGARQWLGPASAAVLLAALVVLVAPAWRRGDVYAMSADQNRPELAAERWIVGHVDRRARILVDDSYYVDLVRAGFAPRFGVVWFYKLDFSHNLDPSIVRHLPQGWRAFDYVVSSPVVRAALAQDPGGLNQVRLALRHSRPVATFGTGSDRVEVRRLVGIGIGSGLIPMATQPTPARPRRARRGHRPGLSVRG